MKQSLKILRQLPFTYSCPVKKTKYMPVKTLKRNLDQDFFFRLTNIYKNMNDALANSSSFLKQAVIPELEQQLVEIRQFYRSSGYRVKKTDPHKQLDQSTNYIMPDTKYQKDNIQISAICKVYFGLTYKKRSETFNKSKNEKVWPIGKHRYIVYKPSLSLIQNIKNIYFCQMLEFMIKYQSNHYLKVIDSNSNDIYKEAQVNKLLDQQDKQDTIVSEIVLRSSCDQFDWIIVDINGLLKSKHSK